MDSLDQAKFDHLKAAYPSHADEYLIEWAVWHSGPPEVCTARYASWLSGLSPSQLRLYEADRSVYRKAKRTRSVRV
jgi:hypothetical protein